MKLLMSALALLFFFSCASSTKVAEEQSSQKSNLYDESFDPNTLNDDDIVIANYDTPAGNQGNINSDPAANAEIREAMGFRVQIVATKSIESATQVELEAKDIFEALNHKVYLIFDAPNYKVRVGDSIKREEADEIRDVAKDYGYRGAFVVRSKVNIIDQ